MSNIPDFAKALAALPKRAKRNSLQVQFGHANQTRAGTMLITAELDPTKYVGRITKLATGRYSWLTFSGLMTEDGAHDLLGKGFEGVKTGRSASVLSAVTQARVAYAHQHAELDAKGKKALAKQHAQAEAL